MDSPTVWAIIWLVTAALFGAGEIAVAGSFFLMPFAIGALIASIASFAGAPIVVGWVLFLGSSVASFFALKPFAAKIEAQLPNPRGFGANRLVGSMGMVDIDIPAGETDSGQVKIGGEQWRAIGRSGMGIPKGTPVEVVEVRGTRIVVQPSNSAGLSSLG